MSIEEQHSTQYQNINKEKLIKILPKGTHHKVSDEIIDLIQSMEKDTGLLQDYMEESFLSHLPVLREVKVNLTDYTNAIKYCNLKKNMDNQTAWEITFPERYRKLEKEGRWNTSHVSMYNSSPLVLKIDAQMALAISIQYAPAFHKMMMKELQLASGWDAHGRETSAMVQHLAASKIIDIAAPPIEQKIALEIGQSAESKNSQQKMIDKMAEIAKNQQKQIEMGMSVEDVQKLNLTIDVEIDED
ncbi:MAG: hypothetical protein KAH01_03965 [Caldisericia bacterium]|nr:hypothetical protein [Caldisericia bacterium]